MAHKKAGGSTSLGRDSQSKRLGTKLYAGEIAKTGSILIRQRGSKIRAGQNVKRGGDDTLFALASGVVKFSRKKMKKFNGSLEWVKFVNVIPVKK
ncbi:MAG: 50S ribosomal protein L27 [Candidatus Buchananbacteria bacterium]